MWFLSNSPWYFTGLDQIVPNLYETTKDQNCQSNLEERDESWRYNLSRLQTIIQSYSNRNSMVLPQDRHIHQRNRIENPEISWDAAVYPTQPLGGNWEKFKQGTRPLPSKWRWPFPSSACGGRICREPEVQRRDTNGRNCWIWIRDHSSLEGRGFLPITPTAI